MKKVVPPKVTIKYSEKPESKEQLRRVNSRIFMVARENIYKRAAKR